MIEVEIRLPLEVKGHNFLTIFVGKPLSLAH